MFPNHGFPVQRTRVVLLNMRARSDVERPVTWSAVPASFSRPRIARMHLQPGILREQSSGSADQARSHHHI